MNKKAMNMMYRIIIHLILIGLISGMFMYKAYQGADTADVKQQVLEKQLALLIDSSVPMTKISVFKEYPSGKINKLELAGGKIHVYVDDILESEGYSYFTEYSVSVEEDSDKYYIKVE